MIRLTIFIVQEREIERGESPSEDRLMSLSEQVAILEERLADCELFCFLNLMIYYKFYYTVISSCVEGGF